MFKNYFKGIEGIADYPVVSLVIFFLFFIAMLIWWFLADKKELGEMSRLPLEDIAKQNNETLNS